MRRDSRCNFEVVFDRHFQDVYAYVAYRVAPDTEAAKDLTQEVFLAAMERWTDLRAEDQPLLWLRAIARNKVADHFRRCSREAESAAQAASIGAGRTSSERPGQVLLVSKVMRGLPDRYVELHRGEVR